MTFEEKTISSEMIYEGAILNLRKDKVNVVTGKTSYREIIEHRGGVAMLAVTDDDKVALIRQYRKPIDKVMLEVPAGKLEIGEKPETAAPRELKEETGYSAGNIQFLSKFYPTVGYSEEAIYLYLCTGLTAGDMELDENEAIDVIEFDLDELYSMAIDGRLDDAKTVIAVIQGYSALKKMRTQLK